MPANDALDEFRSTWLPNITECGLNRLADLLERASPLLIHGAFTRAMPMGCIASHIGWNHPQTAHLQHESGIMWLCRIANLNPATSALIQAWDRFGVGNFELRTSLLAACRAELHQRKSPNEAKDCENTPLDRDFLACRN